MKCQDCGNDSGEETLCPFALQTHYREITIIVCDDCYHNRMMEI